MGLPFLGSSLIFMIVYVWSRRNPTMPVAIWGNDHEREILYATVVLTRASVFIYFSIGFQFQGLYLPWALIAFTVLVGGNPMMDIFGVVAGHLYYFLLEVLPTTKGWNLIQTPSFLYVIGYFLLLSVCM